MLSQEGRSPAKPDGPYLLSRGGACLDKVVRGPSPEVCEPESAIGSPPSGGHLVQAGVDGMPEARWNEMRGEDLVKADHFSEVVLLGGEVLFVSLLLIVVAALTRA